MAEIKYTHLEAVLETYGREVADRYRSELDMAKANATYNLKNSVQPLVLPDQLFRQLLQFIHLFQLFPDFVADLFFRRNGSYSEPQVQKVTIFRTPVKQIRRKPVQ